MPEYNQSVFQSAFECITSCTCIRSAHSSRRNAHSCHCVSSAMDRELLEAEVRRIRASGVTTASDVLEQLHKSAEWATVTISQVRRINTRRARNIWSHNLTPQPKLQSGRLLTRSAIVVDGRVQQRRLQRRNDSKSLSLLHATCTTWNPRSLLAWCSGTLGILETVAHIPPVHTFSPDHQHHLDSRSQPSSSLG